jgi:preprotein translocase subunit SecF
VSVRSAFDTFRGYRAPHFDIIGHKRRWFAVSGAIIVLSLAGLFFRGLNFSIDFTGGTLLQYPDPNGVTPEQVREVLAQSPYDRADAEIQIVGGDQISIRTTALTDLTADERASLFDELAAQAGVDPADISAQVVGPTWGEQISRQALIGLIVVLIAITLYITFRFEWKMAIGAQVATVHDVVITVGVYALTGREVSPATVIAVLTILGFSLYDTVVIYDKIKENTESPAMLAKDTYSGVVNTSVNQVLMRSVNTSLVVVLPILSLLLFGGSTLKDFAFAMLVGVVSGAYSSIFVAAPILAVLKEREPKYQQLRARLEAKPGAERRLRAVGPAPAAVAEGNGEEVAPAAAPAAVGAAAASRATARTGSGQGPRPKSKKRPPAKRRRR